MYLKCKFYDFRFINDVKKTVNVHNEVPQVGNKVEV